VEPSVELSRLGTDRASVGSVGRPAGRGPTPRPLDDPRRRSSADLQAVEDRQTAVYYRDRAGHRRRYDLLRPGVEPDWPIGDYSLDRDRDGTVVRVLVADLTRRPALTRSREEDRHMSPTVDVDTLIERLTRSPATGTAAASFPGLVRAAEHVIADIDAASAATPHGTIPVPTRLPADYVSRLSTERMDRLVARFPLIEVGDGTSIGVPLMPTFSTAPTAGPQSGQKLAAYSKAFEVSPDASPTTIDSTLYLNISLQLEGLAAGITEAFMRLAVVAEAEEQLVAALAAKATAGGADISEALGTFTGLYSPTLLVVPPGALLDQAANVDALTAAGISIVVVPTATVPLLVDPAAVSGYLARMTLTRPDPAYLGRQHAEAIHGRVSVSSAGVATWTT
jgi:hypothetical protein